MILLYGTQKSGTTWLRNIISVLTPVNRDAEWQLPYLVEVAEQHVSTLCVQPAANQRKIQLNLVRAAFKALLAEIPECLCDKSAYPCLPESGRQDSIFAYAADMARYYFPEAKQVMIVRDPRDVLISSKHYFPALRNKCINSSFHDEYLQEYMDSWSRCNLAWLRSKPEFIIRYEDLKLDFVAQVTKLLNALDFDVSDTTLEKIVARCELIDSYRAQNPYFYRKGIIGDWRNEITPHQNDTIWDAGAFAMEQFGYTKVGALSSLKIEPFNGFRTISFDSGMNYNDNAGIVFREKDELRCFIFDDGFYLDVNTQEFIDEPIEADLNQIFVILDLVWDNIDNQDGKWCASVREVQNATDAVRWFKASARPARYGPATTAGFCFPIDTIRPARLEPIRVRIFNGVQTPFTASVKRLRLGLLPVVSRVAQQISDLVDSDAPPCNPINSFYRSVGWTPLHFASNFGFLEVVSRLLDQGVSPNIAEHNGGTALHRAIDNNHIDIAEYLLKRGANPNPIDQSREETPLDIALRRDNSDGVQLMRKYYGQKFRMLNAEERICTEIIDSQDHGFLDP